MSKFIEILKEEMILGDVGKLVSKKIFSSLKYIVLIGIGGSELGARAVYDAIFGYFDSVQPERFPKVIFMDTTDIEYEHVVSNLLQSAKDPNEFLFVIISKSGDTIETVANVQTISSGFIDKNIFNERSVVITAKDSPLWKHAVETNIDLLEIPHDLSGRYSVFSAVGLFPLQAVGIDAEEFQKGGQEADEMEAKASAQIIFENYSRGFENHEMFIFHPELESLGKWWRQLAAESLGKDGKGITPMVAIGSNDLHSMLQLRLAGPQGTFTSFVITDQLDPAMKALYISAVNAYKEANLPFAEINLGDISSRSIGKFMQTKMLETVELARLMNVDPFNQPAIQDYKKEAKEQLSS